ncbi:hypothetical protein Cpin_6330 [Chitinophaga pinensis DSM 2588]|uniref:Uncharacterized protein n=1 Tax=Chitinophaga pinensis (strain ATCC 43595 / DSM 2588 / LMG 13176 / NBRC 15968 / NCIMB 11800 / UQM 2034) TaxID=485918 RepID=A0A979GAC1_CHIPD|nr:hypothetical protein Cpin_6330 [Chitinophaga pinensis DSM 2588]
MTVIGDRHLPDKIGYADINRFGLDLAVMIC